MNPISFYFVNLIIIQDIFLNNLQSLYNDFADNKIEYTCILNFHPASEVFMLLSEQSLELRIKIS